MPAMKKLSVLLPTLFVLLLAACGGGMAATKKVDTVADYGAAVRWSEWERAWSYVDPAMGGGSLPASEEARLKTVKVSGYQVLSRQPAADGLTQRQVVEIRYIDQATQRELTVRDEQSWRTDDKGKHWWLTSGLPQF
jgi:hypothetical protein